MAEVFFYIIIFASNVIQGITGFAGTILAMPFSVQLVGYAVAKPVLNALGVLAGIYVVIGNYRKINWEQFRKICTFLVIGGVVGILVRDQVISREYVLYKILGILVLVIGVKGLAGMKRLVGEKKKSLLPPEITLLLAGMIHAIFVSGGPLVVGYASEHTKNKEEFRSTLSAVWIILNGMILISDIRAGFYTADTIRIQAVSVLFLFAGMFAGSILYRHMSQKAFMILTYMLLCIAGVSLLIK